MDDVDKRGLDFACKRGGSVAEVEQDGDALVD